MPIRKFDGSSIMPTVLERKKNNAKSPSDANCEETKSWTEIIGATTCNDAASIAAIEGTILRLTLPPYVWRVKVTSSDRTTCEKLKNQA